MGGQLSTITTYNAIGESARSMRFFDFDPFMLRQLPIYSVLQTSEHTPDRRSSDAGDH